MSLERLAFRSHGTGIPQLPHPKALRRGTAQGGLMALISVASFVLIAAGGGVTLRNPRAAWRTGWRGIHGLRVKGTGLHILVSGTVIPLPAAAAGTADDLQAPAGKIEAWHNVAARQ